MDLNKVAETLCDQTLSHHHRAVTLFGFQAAILSPDMPQLERYARAIAGIKILEQIEKNMAANSDLEELLNNSDYRRVLGFVLEEGGAKTLRSLMDTKTLWENIRARLDETKDVARLVEFSHRFAKFGRPKARQIGGVTMARHFVCKMGYGSDGTLRARWREYKDCAVLQYLLHEVYPGLRPRQVSGKNFVERLMAQASNVDIIKQFFADYRYLGPVLRPRGYKLSDLTIPNLPERDGLIFALSDFNEEELEAI